MAGRISIYREQDRQGIRVPDDIGDCPECDEYAVGPGYITNPKGTNRLMEYWAHGKGALKIRWFTSGSFKRCVRQLRKYFPQNPEGLCANLHFRATGEWPAEKGIPS